MPIAPSAVVEAPTRVQTPFGLFSVVDFVEETTDRWENGTKWETEPCTGIGGRGVDNCAPAATVGLPKSLASGNGTLGQAGPFTVYATYDCTPVGSGLDKFQERATDRLLNREQARAEQALWTGDLGNFPNLASSATDITPGGSAVSAVVAVGLLEQYIATNYGSLGVIHMSKAAATAALSMRVIFEKNGELVTGLGTPVIAGAGYPGTGLNTNEVQRITTTGAPTGGTFTLTFDGQTTAAIAYNANAAAVQSALEALSNIDPGDITVTGGPLPGTPVDVTFIGQYKGDNVPQMTATSSYTGGTAPTTTVTTTTQGGVGTAAAAGEQWVYASPAIKGYRSEVFTSSDRPGDLLDKGFNNMHAIAERSYLLEFDPCGVAAIRQSTSCVC